MPDAIVLRGLTKTFGATVAVRDFDLVVPQGALYGVIGPNGAGKTTTIRMILSILLPDRGELTVEPSLGRALMQDALLRFLLKADYQLEPGGDYVFTVRAKF